MSSAASPSGFRALSATARRQTLTYFATFVCLGMVVASLGPTLPSLLEQTSTTVANISLLFVARSLGHLLGAFFSGAIYDRVPGHTLLAVMALMMAAAMATVPLMPTLPVLIAVFLVIGLAEGTINVGGNAMLLWLHEMRVGPYLNALHFSFGVGAFVSPLLVAQALIYTSGVSWAYWLIALAFLPLPVALLLLPSPQRHQKTDGADTPAMPWRPFVLLAFVFFLYIGAEASYGGWIASYALAMGLGTEAQSAFLTSGVWGAICLGRFLAIPLAYRVRSQTILLVVLSTAVLAVLVLLIAPPSLRILWIGTLVVGLSFASVFPMLLSFAQYHMRLSGKVTGWLFASAGAGSTFWPWVIGQRFEAVGPDSVLRLIFLCISGALLFFVAALWHTQRKPTAAKAEPSSSETR